MSLSDLAPDLVRPVLASVLALGVVWLAVCPSRAPSQTEAGRSSPATFSLAGFLQRRVYLDSTQFDYLPGPPSSHWLFGNLWMVVS